MPRIVWTLDLVGNDPWPVWLQSDDDSYSEDNLASNDENETNRGLTSDRIKQFSTFNADQSAVDDAICIDGVETNKLMSRLNCNYFYCCECIGEWFGKSVTCPVYRRMYEN